MAIKKEIKFYAIENITQATDKDSIYVVKAKNSHFQK